MARVVFPAVLAIAALLLACGGATLVEQTTTAERLADPTATTEPQATSTLGAEMPQEGTRLLLSASTVDEARQLVPFDLRLPADLPDGVEFRGARSLGVSNALVLYFHDGSSRYLGLTESLGRITPGGRVEPIRVNGVMGEIVYGERSGTPSVSIAWTKNGLWFLANASTLSDEWTLDDILAVLDSIP